MRSIASIATLLAAVALAMAALLVAAEWPAGAFAGCLAGDMTWTYSYVTADACRNSAAVIVLNRTRNTTGWDLVDITPNASLLARDSKTAYYYSGYAEGFQTWDDILSNNYSTQGALHGAARQWIEQDIAWVRSDEGKDPFTRDASRRFVMLLEGIVAGINDAIDANRSSAVKWAFYDIFTLNMQAELGDVLTATAGLNASLVGGDGLRDPAFALVTGDAPLRRKNLDRGFGSHCSALIKVTADDVFFGHDTWSSYSSMLRQFKTYNFETTVTLSGYPGCISSIDDFYMTGNGLAVTETTMSMFNTTLTRMYVTPNTLPVFMRVMIANVWATSGAEWSTMFLTNNSGTYCNEWMILATPLITSSNLQSLPPGTFWVVEQLPGPYSVAQDMTWYLNVNKHWPSFNIPYFPSVYKISGVAAMEATVGTFFSWTRYARAEIFARNQSGVTDLASMQRMMRYNNWQSDPLSIVPACVGCVPATNPQLVIANRADLVPWNVNYGNVTGTALQGYLSFAAFGAIDTKITSWKMMTQNADRADMRASIINGPSTGGVGLPVFDWRTLNASIQGSARRHRGQPDVFDFPFVSVTVKTHSTIPPPQPTPAPQPVAQNMSLDGFANISGGAYLGCAAADASYMYLGGGASASGATAVKVRVGDLQPVASLGLVNNSQQPDDRQWLGLYSVVLGGDGYAYYSVSANPRSAPINNATARASVVKVRVADLTRTQQDVDLGLGGVAVTAVTDGTFGYFATTVAGYGTNCIVKKVRLGDMTVVGQATVAPPVGSGSNAGAQQCLASAVDVAADVAYFVPACWATPCYLYKLQLSTTQLVANLSVPANTGFASLTVARGFAYVSLYSTLVKIDLAAFAIVDTLSTTASLAAPIVAIGDFVFSGARGEASGGAKLLRFRATPGAPMAYNAQLRLPGVQPSIGALFTVAGGRLIATSGQSSAAMALNRVDPGVVVPPTPTSSPVSTLVPTTTTTTTVVPTSPAPTPMPTQVPTPMNTVFKLVYGASETVPTQAGLLAELRSLCASRGVPTTNVAVVVRTNSTSALLAATTTTTTITFALALTSTNSPAAYATLEAVFVLLTTTLSPATVAAAFGASSFSATTAPPAPAPTPAPPSSPAGNDGGVIAGAAIGAVLGIVLLVAVIWFVRRRSAPSSLSGQVLLYAGNNNNARYAAVGGTGATGTEYRAMNDSQV